MRVGAKTLKLRSDELDIALSAEAQIQEARDVLTVESKALAAVADRIDDSFVRAVDMMNRCTGNIIITGMGKAGHVGRKVSSTMASTGARSHFLHPAEAVHGDLGRIASDDIVLAFSHSGESAELTQILRPLKTLSAGLIGVTSRATSALAAASDVAIVYGDVEEACPIGMAPSTSCAVMMALGDSLAFVLMKIRAFTHDDFGRFHPAGTLGRRLAMVDDVMRDGSQLRIAASNLTVAEVFSSVQRPGRRSGAILLVDGDGKLEGIFTDSDLAKLIEKKQMDCFERPVSQFMTRRPKILRLGQKVTDALDLLALFHLSEIPVLDKEDRPVGLIDITDLIDLMPEAAREAA